MGAAQQSVPGNHRDNAPDGWDSARFWGLFLSIGDFPFASLFSPAAGTDNCTCQVLR